MGDHRKPYVTVVAVWIVSSFVLALIVSFPISSVILFSTVLLFVLAAGCLGYKAYHKDLESRDLARDLLSDCRRLASKVFEDFGVVAAQVSAWWLQRETRIREEMAQESEREARKRERLAQLEQKRRTRPADEYLAAGEYEAYKEVLKKNSRVERQGRQ